MNASPPKPFAPDTLAAHATGSAANTHAADNSHTAAAQVSAPRAVIAIHGGAGTLRRHDMSAALEAQHHDALRAVLESGQRVLDSGGSALDAVTLAVELLEACPLFNAGRGAVYTEDGTHELDAAVMDGKTLAAGAVAGVSRLRHPIRAARAVMEDGAHVLMTGAGAERFAKSMGCETVAPDYFDTVARHAQWLKAREANAGAVLDHDGAAASASATASATATGHPVAPIDPDTKFGTVGAVACDRHGHVAAATSTGGLTNKRVGRVGDSPLIGAGCYADDASCAVSATGSGESFIRVVAGHEIGALMEHAGLTLADAAQRLIDGKLARVGGRGGVIAVDRFGNVTLPFNTEGMYRGVARVGEPPRTAIYRDPEPAATHAARPDEHAAAAASAVPAANAFVSPPRGPA